MTGRRRPCGEIHSELLSLAQRHCAVDHGAGGSYAVLPYHPNVIHRGLLSQ